MQNTEEFNKKLLLLFQQQQKSSKTFESDKKTNNSTDVSINASKLPFTSPREPLNKPGSKTSLKSTVSAPPLSSFSSKGNDFLNEQKNLNTTLLYNTQNFSANSSNNQRYLGPIQRPSSRNNLPSGSTNTLTNDLNILPNLMSYSVKPDILCDIGIRSDQTESILSLPDKDLNLGDTKKKSFIDDEGFEEFRLFGRSSSDLQAKTLTSSILDTYDVPNVSSCWPAQDLLASSNRAWNAVLLNDFDNFAASSLTSTNSQHIKSLWSKENEADKKTEDEKK